jgi:hypothetical protein
MKEKLTQSWRDTPTIAKVGLGVIGLYLVSKSFASLKSTFGSAGLGKDYNKDLNQLEKKQISASYTNQTYLTFADRIYSEYVSELFFSDIEDILPIFQKLNNDADWVKLNQAFGERRVMFSTMKLGLGGILGRMFNTKELEEINAVLRKKGIKAQV